MSLELVEQLVAATDAFRKNLEKEEESYRLEKESDRLEKEKEKKFASYADQAMKSKNLTMYTVWSEEELKKEADLQKKENEEADAWLEKKNEKNKKKQKKTFEGLENKLIEEREKEEKFYDEVVKDWIKDLPTPLLE